VSTPTPFVLDLALGLDPCRHPTGLDLDVTFGPPIGVAGWISDATGAGDPLFGPEPIGSAKAHRIDEAFDDPPDLPSPPIGA